MRHFLFCLLLIGFAGCVKKEIATTGLVYGVVKDSRNGQVLANCSVMLMPTGITTITGEDGSFHFEDVLPGNYSVETSCHGYNNNTKNIIVQADHTMPVDIFMIKLGSIHGLIKDSQTSLPLIGCSITLMPTGVTTVTDGNGSFRFDNLQPTTYSLEINCYGYDYEKKSVTVNTNEDSSPIDILLKKTAPTHGRIHGIVKNSEAQPVAGCSVMLMPTGTTITTGSDGSFQFINISPGDYSLEVNCNGYYNEKKNVVVQASENSLSVDFLLRKYDPNNRLAELGAIRIDAVTFKSARVECEIIEQGSSSVTERGFLYSEIPTVTIATATKQIVKTTENIFSATLNNLAEKTDYYVAAYAINGRGTAYSEVVKFTTSDASSISAPTNVIYVSVAGNDANDGRSWSKAKKTIQSAINVATTGKQIWVSAGSYSETLTPKDGIPIYGGFSGSETSTDERTQRTEIYRLSSDNYSETTIVNGFEIKGYSDGGGEAVMLKSNVSLENCRITNTEYCKALSTRGSNITIRECVIERCRGDLDLINIEGETTMINCTIRGNKGGVYVNSYDASLTMYNCVVTNNQQGIRANGPSAMYNCTIANNDDYGIAAQKKVSMYNCLVWNNSLKEHYYGTTAGDIHQYNCLVIESANNQAVKFKRPSTQAGYEANDWQTADWSITTGSTCIDAGSTLLFPTEDIPTDITGNPRVNGKAIDIGAYEW